MPAEPTSNALNLIARKWCDLAKRRRAYFVELYRSGRWKHYYSEEQFKSRMRDVLHAAKKWDELAGHDGIVDSGLRPAA